MNDYEIQKIRDTAFCSGYNTSVSKYERQNGELTDKVKELSDQLTKAKEIIREFVEWANWQGSNCPNFKSIQDKAEAFLNSEVEK